MFSAIMLLRMFLSLFLSEIKAAIYMSKIKSYSVFGLGTKQQKVIIIIIKIIEGIFLKTVITLKME